MQLCTRAVAWPLQAGIVFEHLIPKKAVGARAIALSTSLYRLGMGMMAGGFRRWDVRRGDRRAVGSAAG